MEERQIVSTKRRVGRGLTVIGVGSATFQAILYAYNMWIAYTWKNNLAYTQTELVRYLSTVYSFSSDVLREMGSDLTHYIKSHPERVATCAAYKGIEFIDLINNPDFQAHVQKHIKKQLKSHVNQLFRDIAPPNYKQVFRNEVQLIGYKPINMDNLQLADPRSFLPSSLENDGVIGMVQEAVLDGPPTGVMDRLYSMWSSVGGAIGGEISKRAANYAIEECSRIEDDAALIMSSKANTAATRVSEQLNLQGTQLVNELNRSLHRTANVSKYVMGLLLFIFVLTMGIILIKQRCRRCRRRDDQLKLMFSRGKSHRRRSMKRSVRRTKRHVSRRRRSRKRSTHRSSRKRSVKRSSRRVSRRRKSRKRSVRRSVRCCSRKRSRRRRSMKHSVNRSRRRVSRRRVSRRRESGRRSVRSRSRRRS